MAATPAEAVEIAARCCGCGGRPGCRSPSAGCWTRTAAAVRISELSGAQTAALRGLAVTRQRPGRQDVALARPCAVTDYRSPGRSATSTTRRSPRRACARCSRCPVVVRRRVRGVLYGALRRPHAARRPHADRGGRRRHGTWSRRWSSRTRCEGCCGGRAVRRPGPAGRRGPGRGALGAGARGARGAAGAGPADHRPRAARRPADALRAAGPGRRRRSRRARPVVLAPRELDVLACVAAGATNAAPPSGSGCGRRRSRAICARRCASWARTPGGRRWSPRAGRVCCRSANGRRAPRPGSGRRAGAAVGARRRQRSHPARRHFTTRNHSLTVAMNFPMRHVVISLTTIRLRISMSRCLDIWPGHDTRRGAVTVRRDFKEPARCRPDLVIGREELVDGRP